MGTITIKVPQDIHAEYELVSLENIGKFLRKMEKITTETLKAKPDRISGLFADEAELIDQITESAMMSRETEPFRAS